ncbi:MAG: DciA family protein [Roseovarius sp.]|nr:DciA family protein [Roseovarius sp.]MCY4290766.1 DciA family protein [Roseovarius sp.]
MSGKRKSSRRKGTTRGFKRGSALFDPFIRKAAKKRGFAASRILTTWPEIAGEEVASVSRPIKVSYSNLGVGGTLTLLAAGPYAPIVEMQKEYLRERINAVYGYNAIVRINVTQTSAISFMNGRPVFKNRSESNGQSSPDPSIALESANIVDGIENDDFRKALETLGRNVLSTSRR